jgi:hypothetical protein
MARELEENVEQKPYFEAVQTPSPETDEGTREMGELYPFLISGGSNTERFYFTHINDTTAYKFNIRPKYFGNEARLKKHGNFVAQFAKEIADGTVTICPSMPCIEYWFLLHFEDYTQLLKDYPAVSNRLASYKEQLFPESSTGLKKLLKKEKFLKDSTWVENLCAEGKLDLAAERAEENIAAAVEAGKLEEQSYSYVYKVFKKDRG